MALSAFADKQTQPSPAALKRVLGRSAAAWDELTAHVAAEFAPLEQTWIYPAANWGWALRLKQKKRTVLYMTPMEKHFIAGLMLGDKAVKAAQGAGLPRETLKELDEARKYAEGRGIRMEIRFKKDLEVVKKLAAVKMEN